MTSLLSPKCDFEACFCPCLLLGNIESKLQREKPLCDCVYSHNCELGSHGCQTCWYTCCLATLGWPVSPCLSLHLLFMRRKFTLLYERDDRLKMPNSIARWISSCCCWCVNLREQFQFVSSLWEENQLTFKWDFDLYRDHLEPRPNFPTHSILIFAPQNNATSTFTSKFLQHTSKVALSSDEGVRAAEDALLSEGTAMDLEHYEQVDTGIRTIIQSDGSVSFLEVWKIPPTKFQSESLSESLQKAVLSLYIFDLADKPSIDKVKKAFSDHTRFATGRRIIIIINYDQTITTKKPRRMIEGEKRRQSTFSPSISPRIDDGTNSQAESRVVSQKTNRFNNELEVPTVMEQQHEDEDEDGEKSPITLTIFAKTQRELQNWARQKKTILYEVTLNKQDDFIQLHSTLKETLKGNGEIFS